MNTVLSDVLESKALYYTLLNRSPLGPIIPPWRNVKSIGTLRHAAFCTLQTIQIGQVPAKIFNFASRDFHRFEENIEFEGISASG